MTYNGHSSYRAFIQAVDIALTNTYNAAIASINAELNTAIQAKVGPSGPQGSAGVIGATGPQGPTGAAGPGQQGATGVRGVTGPTGPRGATGPSKATGATGSRGTVGANAVGATGITGTTGINGVVGLTGATGIAGSTGPIGATGATGPSLSAITMTSTYFPNDFQSSYSTTTDVLVRFTGTYWDYYNTNNFYIYRLLTGNVDATALTGAERNVMLAIFCTGTPAVASRNNGTGFASADGYITIPAMTCFVKLEIALTTLTLTGSPVTWTARIRQDSITGTVLGSVTYNQTANRGSVVMDVTAVSAGGVNLYGTLECSGAFTDSTSLFYTCFNCMYARAL